MNGFVTDFIEDCKTYGLTARDFIKVAMALPMIWAVIAVAVLMLG